MWEVAYAMLAGPVLGYFALRSYYVIGIGWLCHAARDVVHHLYGNPIWPFMGALSLGCTIFDTVIGVWFFARQQQALQVGASGAAGPSSGG